MYIYQQMFAGMDFLSLLLLLPSLKGVHGISSIRRKEWMKRFDKWWISQTAAIESEEGKKIYRSQRKKKSSFSLYSYYGRIHICMYLYIYTYIYLRIILAYVRTKEGRKEGRRSDIAALLWRLGIVPKIGPPVMRQTGFLLLLPSFSYVFFFYVLSYISIVLDPPDWLGSA